MCLWQSRVRSSSHLEGIVEGKPVEENVGEELA